MLHTISFILPGGTLQDQTKKQAFIVVSEINDHLISIVFRTKFVLSLCERNHAHVAQVYFRPRAN